MFTLRTLRAAATSAGTASKGTQGLLLKPLRLRNREPGTRARPFPASVLLRSPSRPNPSNKPHPAVRTREKSPRGTRGATPQHPTKTYCCLGSGGRPSGARRLPPKGAAPAPEGSIVSAPPRAATLALVTSHLHSVQPPPPGRALLHNHGRDSDQKPPRKRADYSPAAADPRPHPRASRAGGHGAATCPRLRGSSWVPAKGSLLPSRCLLCSATRFARLPPALRAQRADKAPPPRGGSPTALRSPLPGRELCGVQASSLPGPQAWGPGAFGAAFRVGDAGRQGQSQVHC
ncbi:uncharacterized protein [Saccopteryx leptura]|uniref:uncharacterized protein n=1 Tax=Saccopteryx leptura TaxID=249018 RepID=UPI00339D2E72